MSTVINYILHLQSTGVHDKTDVLRRKILLLPEFVVASAVARLQLAVKERVTCDLFSFGNLATCRVKRQPFLFVVG